MTPRIGAAIAAGVLAAGTLVGAAGTIVVRDATTPDLAGHMHDLSAMRSMMGSGGVAGMMGSGGMMGGSPMGPGASMAPDASMTPGEHDPHHASASPEAMR